MTWPRWLLLLAALCSAPSARADEAADAGSSADVLASWSHTPQAQRNRVLDDALAPEVQEALLEILARGVRPCDCFPRRVRWAWALAVPGKPDHPAVVVSFTDPPRDQALVAHHVRFAFIRWFEGRYVVTSAIALRRPALAQEDASLTVRMLPRRDTDGDAQLDIALRFEERWPEGSYCGKATFPSAKEQLVLAEEACTAEPSGEERSD